MDPRASVSAMARRERDILEHAVHTLAEQAAQGQRTRQEKAISVGHGRSCPLVTHAKMAAAGDLKVKADLERNLEDPVFDCSKCDLDVHELAVSESGRTMAHGEPAV